MRRAVCAASLALACALAPADARPRENAAAISARLARFVKPTGHCGTSREVIATYYDRGRLTASGARFDKNAFTAAHRSLPFGTRVHLRNPHTGRQLDVVITDRGPYTIAWIDVTAGAARALGGRWSTTLCVN